MGKNIARKSKVRPRRREHPDFVAALRWLERQPGVSHLVRGDRTGHKVQVRPPGYLRSLAADAKSVHVYAYYDQGLENVFVHAEPGPVRDRWIKMIDQGAEITTLLTQSQVGDTARTMPDARNAVEHVVDDAAATIVDVTPDLAVKWLERNTRNRPLRQYRIDSYAADMREARWMISPDGIAFDRDGNVVNGQHRLWTVIESGCTVPMMVMRGLDPNVISVLDDHLKRNLRDVVNIKRPGASVQSIHCAIAAKLMETSLDVTAMNADKSKRRTTRQQQMDVLDRHWDAIVFAVQDVIRNRTIRGITQGTVLAPIARAFYSEDRDLLKRFGHVLTSGVMEEPGDKAAALLRRVLTESKSSGVRTLSPVIYRKTERAVRAFLDREPIKMLYEAAGEMFLLPEEQPVKVRK